MECIRRWFAWFGVVIALAGCGGGSTSGPSISVQPVDAAATIGSTAAFAVTASGTDVTYQWQISPDGGTTWSDAAGAVAASYTTGALASANNGERYRVVVRAAGASVVSSAVTLTVTAAAIAPTITVPPASQNVTAPANAVFAVTATGTSLAYQWQRSTDGGATWTDISGASAAIYDTGATAVAMNGHQVRVGVANGVGGVTSAAVTLGVDPAPVTPAFVAQPTSQSVTANNAAIFTVAATGAPTPALQWQRSTDGGASYANIAGAIDSTYNTGPTALSQNGEHYRVLGSNIAGSATSNTATLSVSAAAQAPVITTDPIAQAVAAPNPASFTAAASGVPTPNWQWQMSTDGGTTFTNISGATGPSYITPATVAGDDGKRYRAVASNTAGTVHSAAVTLSVSALVPLTIVTSSLPVVTVNAPYSVTLAASGGTAPYRWSIVGILPASLSLNTLSGVISGTAPAQAGSYSWDIRVQDGANPAQSAQANVELSVQPICDFGFGFLQVDGAPASVGGKLCPQQAIPPGTANSLGSVNAAWLESNPGVFEGVGVEFEFGSGRLVSVTYNLNDATRNWSYSCTIPATEPSYPACTGVTVDPVGGTVTFIDTEVRNGTVQPFKLNGKLRY